MLICAGGYILCASLLEGFVPEKLDRCIEGLLAKWRDNPDEAPKKYKSGEEWKEIQGDEDRRSAATAICRASTGLAESWTDTLAQIEHDLVSVILAEDGDGPVLRGVAFVNRPYIKFMDPLEVVYRNGKEMIKAQLVRFGIYRHPNGPDGKLPFTREFWNRVKDNFLNNVYGQKIFADKRHDPNAGSFGELKELEETVSGVNGYFDPTPAGLQAVKSRDVNYASIDLVFGYKDTLVEAVASEDARLEEVDIAEEAFGVMLFNPFHDKKGRFTTGGGAGAGGGVSTHNVNVNVSQTRSVASKVITGAVGGYVGANIGALGGLGAGILITAATGMAPIVGVVGGTAIGAGVGTIKGALVGWRLAEDDEIAKAISKLKAMLNDFIAAKDLEVLALDATSNPDMDKIGFLPGEHEGQRIYYVDKKRANEILGEFDRLGLFEIALDGAQQIVEVSEMADKTKNEPGTETTVDLSEIEARLAALEEREQKLKLAEQKIDGMVKTFEEDKAAFEKEQARRSEALRREKVKVFLAEQSQPSDGKCFDKGLLDLFEAILMGDPVTGGDGAEVQLAEDASTAEVHGYYRPAIELLLSKMPRTVPVGSKVDSEDKRPNDKKVELTEAYQNAYNVKVLAIQNSRGYDYQLTEEDEKKIRESLDRTFGIVREE